MLTYTRLMNYAYIQINHNFLVSRISYYYYY